MLQITPQHKIYISVEAVDFRKGIEGLAAVCRTHLLHDPFSGKIFVFSNKSRTSIKLLVYDGNGFWLCQKRFSKGKIKWWPSNQQQADNIKAAELVLMLQQGNPTSTHMPDDWRRL